MQEPNVSPDRKEPEPRDELADSWFDLPVIVEEPPPSRVREPEDELDESWFDGPRRGIRRIDVLGR